MHTLRKAQETLRRETFGDDHVSVNVEIWSVREEVLRASACLSSEGQGRGSLEYGSVRGRYMRLGHASSHDCAGVCGPCTLASVPVAEFFLIVVRLCIENTLD